MALVPFPSQAAERTQDPDLDPDDHGSDPDDSDAAGKMSFLEHLDELRKRIVHAVIAMFGGFVVACFFIYDLVAFVMKPLADVLPKGQTLVYTEPTEAFVLWIKVAAIAGIFLSSPVIMFQVWMFIAPGLYANEKKLAVPFVVLSSILFTMGGLFSHYVVFPLTWNFFVSFNTPFLTFMPRIEPTFALYMKLLFGMGLVFQMPVIVLFLARMGVLTARFMIKNFKYAFLIIFIVAAVITPDGNPISQAAVAGPMVVLYGFSIGLAWVFGKRKKKEED